MLTYANKQIFMYIDYHMYKPAIGSVSINQHRPSIPHIPGVYTEYLRYTLHVQTILDMHTHCA